MRRAASGRRDDESLSRDKKATSKLLSLLENYREWRGVNRPSPRTNRQGWQARHESPRISASRVAIATERTPLERRQNMAASRGPCQGSRTKKRSPMSMLTKPQLPRDDASDGPRSVHLNRAILWPPISSFQATTPNPFHRSIPTPGIRRFDGSGSPGSRHGLEQPGTGPTVSMVQLRARFLRATGMQFNAEPGLLVPDIS